MTDREAIRWFIASKNYECKTTQEYFNQAISAIQERIERERNDPLTLDDLRKMDGEPVWATPLGFWVLVISKRGERV